VGEIAQRPAQIQVVAGTNEFLVVIRSTEMSSISWVGMDGTLRSGGSYRSLEVAGGGGKPIWAAWEQLGTAYRGEVKGNFFIARTYPLDSSRLPQRNVRIAASGTEYLVGWEESTGAGVVLRAAQFAHGSTEALRPMSLIAVTLTNEYQIIASEEGFMIVGRDGIGAPEYHPLGRQYLFHWNKENQEILGKISPLDHHIRDEVTGIGLRRDFLLVHTRTEEGFEIAGQWVFNGLGGFFSRIRRGGGGVEVGTIGDEEREYLMESSSDLMSWKPVSRIRSESWMTVPAEGRAFFRLSPVPF
jgi:hypothetical protein